jgi:hypothetical protein
VKLATDNALNITRADKNMITKASITCAWKRNFIQWFNSFNTFPFRFHLMIAAPDTFSIAYKKQNMTALNTIIRLYRLVYFI